MAAGTVLGVYTLHRGSSDPVVRPRSRSRCSDAALTVAKAAALLLAAAAVLVLHNVPPLGDTAAVPSSAVQLSYPARLNSERNGSAP